METVVNDEKPAYARPNTCNKGKIIVKPIRKHNCHQTDEQHKRTLLCSYANFCRMRVMTYMPQDNSILAVCHFCVIPESVQAVFNKCPGNPSEKKKHTVKKKMVLVSYYFHRQQKEAED
jgi:hypothetical protein